MRFNSQSTWRLLAMAALLTLLVGCSRAEDPADRYQYGRADRERLPQMTLLNHQKVMEDLLGEPSIPVKTIGILVYEGVDTLEVIAPMAVFSELMDVKIEYIGLQPGTVSTTLIDLVVDRTIDEVDGLDLLVVPGGNREGMQTVLQDAVLKDWLVRMDQSTQLTTGIGYGTVLLAEAGLLEGKRMAFNWLDAEANVQALGGIYDAARYTNDGKYWTSVGSTGAIDMSLAMLKAIAGEKHLQGAMLDLEYDPDPPFEGGTPATTPPEVLEAIKAASYRHGALTLLDSAHPVSPGSHPDEKLDVGVMVYPDFFTLDVIGPLAVLSQLPGANVRLVRYGDKEKIKSGRSRFIVPTSIADVEKLDVLVVPGGSTGTWDITQDSKALDWIRKIDAQSRYTSSVCTGSWILGAAGLLEGRKATTNWYRAEQMMTHYGASFVPERYVQDGKYWTSAGVSAGLDLAFALIADLQGNAAAEAAMLRLNYHPEPPMDAGTPEKTDDLVLDMMHQMYDYLMVPLIKKDRERHSQSP